MNNKGQAILMAIFAIMGFIIFILAIPMLFTMISWGTENSGGMTKFVVFIIPAFILSLFIFVFYKLSQSS